jgi:hypothetical protein
MAAKGWLIGCGAVAAVGVLVVVLGVAFVSSRVGDVRRGMEDARGRYTAVNREFPFTVPSSGEIVPERFTKYLQVRRAVESAMSPVGETRGLRRLMVMTSIPDEVSQVQVDALRAQSMSLDEYRWISRQIYTTVAAEANRADADPAIRLLQPDFAVAMRRQAGGLSAQIGGPPQTTDEPARPGVTAPNGFGGSPLLDFTWLRVPASTRNLVRDHADDLAKTANAAIADQLLLNLDFGGSGR